MASASGSAAAKEKDSTRAAFAFGSWLRRSLIARSMHGFENRQGCHGQPEHAAKVVVAGTRSPTTPSARQARTPWQLRQNIGFFNENRNRIVLLTETATARGRSALYCRCIRRQQRYAKRKNKTAMPRRVKWNPLRKKTSRESTANTRLSTSPMRVVRMRHLLDSGPRPPKPIGVSLHRFHRLPAPKPVMPGTLLLVEVHRLPGRTQPTAPRLTHLQRLRGHGESSLPT